MGDQKRHRPSVTVGGFIGTGGHVEERLEIRVEVPVSGGTLPAAREALVPLLVRCPTGCRSYGSVGGYGHEARYADGVAGPIKACGRCGASGYILTEDGQDVAALVRWEAAKVVRTILDREGWGSDRADAKKLADVVTELQTWADEIAAERKAATETRAHPGAYVSVGTPPWAAAPSACRCCPATGGCPSHREVGRWCDWCRENVPAPNQVRVIEGETDEGFDPDALDRNPIGTVSSGLSGGVTWKRVRPRIGTEEVPRRRWFGKRRALKAAAAEVLAWAFERRKQGNVDAVFELQFEQIAERIGEALGWSSPWNPPGSP